MTASVCLVAAYWRAAASSGSDHPCRSCVPQFCAGYSEPNAARTEPKVIVRRSSQGFSIASVYHSMPESPVELQGAKLESENIRTMQIHIFRGPGRVFGF